MNEKQVTCKALKVEDVEKAVSACIGREVSIGEIAITLYDDLSLEDGKYHMSSATFVDDDVVFDENDEHVLDKFLPKKGLVDTDMIFDFDTDLLADFERETSVD